MNIKFLCPSYQEFGQAWLIASMVLYLHVFLWLWTPVYKYAWLLLF